MDNPEQSVATLVFPQDYIRQINSVAGVTTQNIIVIKRKLMSAKGYELAQMPLSECVGIEYREELAFMRMIFGALLAMLVLLTIVMLLKYWDDLQPGTRVPVGALALGGIYGTLMVLGGRRHRFTFKMLNGTTFTWKSRTGDHKVMKVVVDKLIEFARSRSLMSAGGQLE